MTKKERVTAAIRGEEVDKIPSGFSLHFPKIGFYYMVQIIAEILLLKI